jgi:hypothetical protein
MNIQPGEPIRSAGHSARRDGVLRAQIRRVWGGNFPVHGVRKAWQQRRREGMLFRTLSDCEYASNNDRCDDLGIWFGDSTTSNTAPGNTCVPDPCCVIPAGTAVGRAFSSRQHAYLH